MIARMAKCEIAGPQALLRDCLTEIRDLGLFQVEPAVRQPASAQVASADGSEALETASLEGLGRTLDELCGLLPAVAVRDSYLHSPQVVAVLQGIADRHLKVCHGWSEQRDALLRERAELERYTSVLDAIGARIGANRDLTAAELIGITLRDPGLLDRVHLILDRLTQGRYHLDSTALGDGSLIGLIITPLSEGTHIRKILNDEQLPELPFPADLQNLSFPDRARRARRRLAAVRRAVARIERQQERFARRWLPLYRQAALLIARRFTVIDATGAAARTGMCFLLHGWLCAEDLPKLRERLTIRFQGQVAVQELPIPEQELAQVPVVLKNPSFLRPFERFTRILPLPRYSSWDPTPFIAAFFPLFFGLMLGDLGHGLVLLTVVLAFRRQRRLGWPADMAHILAVSACWTCLFGVLFGECFGEAGGSFLGLQPLVAGRTRAVVPMLAASVAIGGGHVLFGLILGLAPFLKSGDWKEVLGRSAAICLLGCLALAAITLLLPPAYRFAGTPVATACLALIPFLFLSGGLLAPVELLRHLGNIVSYARLMAIGLSSVYLADAANRLAGLPGQPAAGITIWLFLHALALILGVFAPAIHGIRLHFVEFLSKFIIHDGRCFTPLGKTS